MIQENQRGFFGIIIPIELLDNQELTVAEKFVYAYVASYAKCCLDSNEKIAKRIGVSKETVSRALSKLQKLKYVYVEFVNNNSSARRLYAVFENPKKLACLSKKDMFLDKCEVGFQEKKQSFTQVSQNDMPQNEASQNVMVASQNVKPHNRGEASQNVNQRIRINRISENSSNLEQPVGLAGELPANRLDAPDKPVRKDFPNSRSFLDALWAWNREHKAKRTLRLESANY